MVRFFWEGVWNVEKMNLLRSRPFIGWGGSEGGESSLVSLFLFYIICLPRNVVQVFDNKVPDVFAHGYTNE